MAEVILSNRMQALTDMVTPGTVITDVGCDHGFVSVYLVQRGLSPRVIAMDVRSGPLERAREHIREYGLQDRIETRLSDGLHGLKTGETNGMICAGMGGPLMEKILTEGREQAQGFAELILQPQSEIPHFRTFLMDEGYLLLDENIIYEEGKYYFMMKVRRSRCAAPAPKPPLWAAPRRPKICPPPSPRSAPPWKRTCSPEPRGAPTGISVCTSSARWRNASLPGASSAPSNFRRPPHAENHTLHRQRQGTGTFL